MPFNPSCTRSTTVPTSFDRAFLHPAASRRARLCRRTHGCTLISPLPHSSSRVCYRACTDEYAEAPACAPQEVRCFDLLSDDEDVQSAVHAKISEAFVGPDALGLIAVTDVPGLRERRDRLLPLASRLASLPPEVLSQYEHSDSKFSIGWSQGQETVDSSGSDIHKGSFYANPLYDIPGDGVDLNLASVYPSLYEPNIWPTEHLPELEGAFKALGELIVQVAASLVTHCDRLVLETAARGAAAPLAPEAARVQDDEGPGQITDSVVQSRCTKARLLHYSPLPLDEGPQNWCGWHTDHGTLTGLTSAMFLKAGHEEEGEQECSSPGTGLFVRTRSGRVVRVRLRRDQLAFQAGQCMQVMSGGLLQATPHMVRGEPDPRRLSRNTFAVFLQPNADEVLDCNVAAVGDVADVGVPRWKRGMTFGQFAERTVSSYYN